jgi:hypothetical protein
MKQIIAAAVAAYVAALFAAAAPAGAYGLGGDYTFHPSPALTPAPITPRIPPSYIPPRFPSPPPLMTPPPRPYIDLRPIVRPQAPDVVHLPPPPTPAPAPRFEGGAIAAPTPSGGGVGGAVIRDNKTNTTGMVQGRTEPGGTSITGGVIINPPLGNPPQARSAEPEVPMPSGR